ncbi:MAG: penicillin-binding protein activator LpoB [Candidatus Sumerlaeota bacterium]|nr:penicillin-binding protein activator LpoB [Candidatus Sumerlaeota bacterium]
MKKNKLVTILFALSCACAALIGCAPTVSYQDPQATETVNIDFGRTDLQMIANQMISSLLKSGVIAEGQRPVVYFQGVRNVTDEHIDTKNITDKIKVALVQSNKFRVTGAMEVPDEIRRQVEYQTGSGMVSADKAVRIGHQIGAKYCLYGDLTSIRKSAGRVEDVYFKFTLQLINIESGVLEWAEDKEISKGQRRAWFGG